MTLSSGMRIGAYEVVSKLGEGGMGEVYRARDSRLGRAVAIKILPDALAADPDRMARFEREARTLASLNHPGIAVLYEVEQHGGRTALILELVEGPTLAERIARGPVPVREALAIIAQVADALETAHDQGIVHRDIKPANIKLTTNGRVKVLDFGLAKATGADTDDNGHTHGPTITVATRAGVIIGTPAYMSPEQARGEAAGTQTDIWACGVLLFELLAGRAPFTRPSATETLAQVLEAQPDYSKLPPRTPPALATLIRRCLEKDRRRRVHHAADLRIQIEELLTTEAGDVAAGSEPRHSRASRASLAAGVVGLVALAGAGGWLAGRGASPQPAAGLVRLTIPFAEQPYESPFGTRYLAIADDGSRVAYAGASRLWVRRMDQKDPIALDERGNNPFFSPDGQWIGYFTAPGLVKKPVGGGAAVVIARTSDRAAGASWHENGTIVFATSEGLYRVPDAGGEPTLILSPNRALQQRLYAWPHFLPDGNRVLFTIVPDDAAAPMQIALVNLETRESSVVLTSGSASRYVPSGHLIYASGTAVKAVPFDVRTGATTGDAVSLPGIEIGSAGDTGAAEFAVSSSGTIVFLADVAGIARPLTTLSWSDRNGNEEPLPLGAATFSNPRLSPDGTRVAVELFTGSNRDIWILSVDRMSLTQLTDGPTEDLLPLWAPDGQRVFFASDRTGNFDVYSQAADGASGARLEFAGPGFHAPQSFTPDGLRLLVLEAMRDVGVLTLANPDRLEPLLHSNEFQARLPIVSPDGNWVAYESDESGGRFEVFLRPFPDANSRREQISLAGGSDARWSPDGSELYYVNSDGGMMAVSIRQSPDLSISRPIRLFPWERPAVGRPYDVGPDGRFLITRAVPAGRPAGSTQVFVVLNALSAIPPLR